MEEGQIKATGKVICDCSKSDSVTNSGDALSHCTNSDCPYKYLSRDEFTSEAFKIQLKNLHHHIGFKQFKTFLTSLNIKYRKIKLLDRVSFISFGSAEDRDNALAILDGYQWKGLKIVAKLSRGRADPLLQKRSLATLDSELNSKRLCEEIDKESDQLFNPIDSLRDSVTAFWRLLYDPDQLEKKRDFILTNLSLMYFKLRNCNPDLVQHLRKTDLCDRQNRPIVCPFGKVHPSPIQTKYRNKSELTIGLDHQTSNLIIGFRYGKYRAGSISIGSFVHLNLLSDRVVQVLTSVEQFLISCQTSDNPHLSAFTVFDPITHNGNWRQVLIRVSQLGHILLLLDLHPQQCCSKQLDDLENELKTWFCLDGGNGVHTNLTSLYFSMRTKSSDPYNAQYLRHIFGPGYIEEKCCGLNFRISLTSFFQVNTLAAEVLYNRIAELSRCQMSDLNSNEPLKSSKTERILLDICCGTGTIGLCLSKHFDRVIGIELIPEAVEDAKLNAQNNGIANAKFYSGKAEDILYDILSSLPQDCDLLTVVDPPRAGLHTSVVQTIRRFEKIQKIIYISCNLEASMKNIIDFARPISNRYLGDPFLPTFADAVDLFPQTPHVEVILILERQIVS